MLHHSILRHNMLFMYRYTAKPNRYPIFNNQYRYRGFDVGIPFTEKYRIPTILLNTANSVCTAFAPP